MINVCLKVKTELKLSSLHSILIFYEKDFSSGRDKRMSQVIEIS